MIAGAGEAGGARRGARQHWVLHIVAILLQLSINHYAHRDRVLLVKLNPTGVVLKLWGDFFFFKSKEKIKLMKLKYMVVYIEIY